MFFNSVTFAIFLPIVFLLYWFVFNQSKKTQNTILILASYYFYSCWDWRFLFLLIFSTILDYTSGIMMGKYESKTKRRFWLWLTISINLGFLGVFKYYDFFVSSFTEFVQGFGLEVHPYLLQLVLPVGISFYTFHGLSYVIDIYYKRIQPEKNFIDYSLFVSYFPLLVAGPIERATHLLPQVKIKRFFQYEQGIQGIKLILFGLFKKVVVADNCAFFVNQLFENHTNFTAVELWIGSFLFAFQIYGDFSGYSDIAIGTSKLFGIELLKNFNFPYFAKDIADFWRRWHISLSSWFRDYLYIPLGGSKGSKWYQIRNVFVIFLVSGFWHGANWTFIMWGGLHAFLFIPLLLVNKNRRNLSNVGYSYKDFPKIILTFLLVSLAWIFFRADSVSIAFDYLHRMLQFDSISIQFYIKNAKYILLSAIVFVSSFTLLLLEWCFLKKYNGEIVLSKGMLFLLVAMLLFMGVYRNQLSFIYFQF
ncbi:MBOAT family protein [Flavobacterium sp. NRK F7]|uniref:MBOAT family O-acyltransferase n=1 Tax=Flavobacterium sp. NRK F7 TaxID=2954930 RepID=UPI00209072CA|nr:MBOAT family O-acyltransferase [Flavobacterium sp. NRK F7]MCO6164195.1 MBOAT family protein [Flavobacterium sp. NRK F7]